MRLLFIIFLFFSQISLWAQAEYQKVKELFPVPHTNINVNILKGHFDDVHPVEFFLGQRGQNVKGYYRLVSSGDLFMLEGELINKELILTESNSEGRSLGQIYARNFEFGSDQMYEGSWSSIDNKEFFKINIKKAEYSTFPPLAFRSFIRKYCDYNNDECISIEVFEEGKADVILGASAQRKRIVLNAKDPLSFSLEDSTLYEEFNNKLRAKKNGTFQFFEKENEVEIKRMYFASFYQLSNVEFPVLDHKEFDEFILITINKEKDQIKSAVNKAKNDPSAKDFEHYQYNWNGWTEIDFLSSTVISGRIILNLITPKKKERKVIPFIFDLVENESISIENLFKSEIDVVSFFEKRVIAELQNNRDIKGMDASDFKYYSLSEQYILVTTDFDYINGIQSVKIPYSDVKSWIKRNSLIKKIMRT